MSAPKISLSLSAASKTSTTPIGRNPTNGLKRPRSVALHDDEDEDDEDNSRKLGRSERVSHFDRAAGGAIDTARPPPSGPATLVIARQANRDWREAANARHRQRSGLPGAASAARNGGAGAGAAAHAAQDPAAAMMEERRPQFGLTLAAPATSRRSGQFSAEEEQEQRQGAGEEANGDAPAAVVARPQTEDERAMDALLGRTSTDRALVLPQLQPNAMTEAEAFSHDFRDAPEMATLDDYARVPVEQFGAALLRGMGWKDGEGIGSLRGKKIEKPTAKIPERRAALLGIGAKEDAAVTAEMGAWGKAAKKGKEVKIYNPVMLRDKRTGEMLTEEELEKKRDREEREKYEAEFDRKERKKEVGRSENGDRRKKDDDRDRRRHDRDDDSDEEYYRRKEKERRMRRDREDRDRDYDRDESRRHRERNERHDDHGREHSRRHRDHDDRDKYRDHERRRERDRRR